MAQMTVIVPGGNGTPKGWECPRCHQIWAPSVQNCTCAPARPVIDPVQSWFDRCPCNPKNGGSGVCGCVPPFPTVTC